MPKPRGGKAMLISTKHHSTITCGCTSLFNGKEGCKEIILTDFDLSKEAKTIVCEISMQFDTIHSIETTKNILSELLIASVIAGHLKEDLRTILTEQKTGERDFVYINFCNNFFIPELKGKIGRIKPDTILKRKDTINLEEWKEKAVGFLNTIINLPVTILNKGLNSKIIESGDWEILLNPDLNFNELLIGFEKLLLQAVERCNEKN